MKICVPDRLSRVNGRSSPRSLLRASVDSGLSYAGCDVEQCQLEILVPYVDSVVSFPFARV